MPNRNTTDRGLGYTHQKRRRQLLPAALNTPCPAATSPRCTGLMTDPRRMDLDHTIPRALGGTHGDRIICSPCNRSAGARLGNQLRRHTRQRALPQW